jgi:predicted O-methyltransferase YrrM
MLYKINLLLYLTKIIVKYSFFGPRRYLNLFLTIIFRRPKTILEIGVYRGTRSLEMIKIANIFNEKIKYFGFDLFENFYTKKNVLENELSKKPINLDKIKKKLKLSKNIKINLSKGLTKKTLPVFLKKKIKIDFAFIDGGHSITTIKNDWKYVEKLLNKKSAVIFDDYYLNDPNLIKKFGCNFLKKKLSKKYKFSLLPFTDKFLEKKKYKFIKMAKVTF